MILAFGNGKRAFVFRPPDCRLSMEGDGPPARRSGLFPPVIDFRGAARRRRPPLANVLTVDDERETLEAQRREKGCIVFI